jgi:hypothetical protein
MNCDSRQKKVAKALCHCCKSEGIHLFSYMESHAQVQRHKEGKSVVLEKPLKMASIINKIIRFKPMCVSMLLLICPQVLSCMLHY